MNTLLTPEKDAELEALFAKGLIRGLEEEETDSKCSCIQGSISLVMDGHLSDTPSCVASPDREWSIPVNDALWTSNSSRAEALLPVARAQIGTAGTDRQQWLDAMLVGTVNRLLPYFLDHLNNIDSTLVTACREVTFLEEARALMKKVKPSRFCYDWDRTRDLVLYPPPTHAIFGRNLGFIAYSMSIYLYDGSDDFLSEVVAVALDAYAAENK